MENLRKKEGTNVTELSQKILQEFQVRKSRKQKDAFLSLLKAHYPQITVEQSGFIKSNNIILGDISSAKTIFSAHYDTCARLPIPNFIAPRNVLISLLYSLLLLLPMIIILFAMNFPVSLISNNFWVHYVFTMVAATIMMALMIAGPANKHNANDNTSGVITLIEIYNRLTDQQRAQAAFIFFDNEEIGLLGSSQFKKKHGKEMENKLLINFDCVADGDHFLIAVTKDAEKIHGETLREIFKTTENKAFAFGKADKIFYPSDHIGFPQALAVAAFHKKKFIGHYIGRIHTGRDTVFDETNIKLLTDYCIEYIDKI